MKFYSEIFGLDCGECGNAATTRDGEPGEVRVKCRNRKCGNYGKEFSLKVPVLEGEEVSGE